MKIIRIMSAAFFAALLSTAVSAHPGHAEGPPVTRDDVSALGGRVVGLLVQDKKLALSWQGRQPKEVSSRDTPSGLIWVVSFENPEEADRSKRMVYIFFDEFGSFLGGNHEGLKQ